jgi:hypothetical protein
MPIVARTGRRLEREVTLIGRGVWLGVAAAPTTHDREEAVQ